MRQYLPRFSTLGFSLFVCGLLLAGSISISAQTATAGQIIISEFRLRGPTPNAATNEFTKSTTLPVLTIP